jgi:Flp pilus assembly pilin Flp
MSRQSGQGLIEYIILVALVAVAAISFVRVFQHNLNIQLANIANSLSGKEVRQRKGEVIPSDFEKKDFGNFMNGATSREQQ